MNERMNFSDSSNNDTSISIIHTNHHLNSRLETEQILLAILAWWIPVISAIVWLINALFVFAVWRFTVYHLNLRILLAHISLCSVWTGLGRSTKSIYLFFQLFVFDGRKTHSSKIDSGCPDVQSNGWFLTEFPSLALTFSALCICLERAYALYRFRTYNRRSAYRERSIWLPILLIAVISWSPCIGLHVYYVFFVDSSIDPINITNSSSLSPDYHLKCFHTITIHKLVVLILFISQALICVVWLSVYARSRRLLTKISINRAQQTLAARFQLSQNFGVVRSLSPWICSHVLFHTCTSFIYLAIDTNENYTDERMMMNRKMVLLFTAHALQLIYCVIYPITCVYRNSVLRKRLKRWLGRMKNFLFLKRGRNTNTVKPAETTLGGIGSNTVNGTGGGKELNFSFGGSTSANDVRLTEIRSFHTTGNDNKRIIQYGGDKKKLSKTERRNKRIHVFSILT